MRRQAIGQILIGANLVVASFSVTYWGAPVWVATTVLSIIGGAYLATGLIGFVFDRIYYRMGGKTMFFDPFLSRQAHLRGARVMVFPQDRESKKMIRDLTDWTYLVQFDDGQETFAHRTELKKTPEEIGQDT